MYAIGLKMLKGVKTRLPEQDDSFNNHEPWYKHYYITSEVV